MTTERKSIGSGYGKVILFNEHFVVHGVPAIAGAMSDATVAAVTPGDGPRWTITDERPETPGYKTKKLADQRRSIEYIFADLGLDPAAEPVHLHLGGPLLCASGLGASGASCTAIARALNDYFALGRDDDAINHAAYEGEKGYHGTPSGLDNTVATFGGLLWYLKGDPPSFDPVETPQPLEIVLGNTGRVADTTAAVAGVGERREQEPDVYIALFEAARTLAEQGRAALAAGDSARVGWLMNLNHRLLQAIGVSSPELDELVEIAWREDAPGAKLTGGGLGGNMVALTPGSELQDRVADAMEAAGYKTIRTRIG